VIVDFIAPILELKVGKVTVGQGGKYVRQFPLGHAFAGEVLIEVTENG
jgi:hypothetical protein